MKPLRNKQRSFRFTLLCAITILSLFTIVAPVAAVTSCSGSSCNNTDPSTYGVGGTACSLGSPRTEEYTYDNQLAYVELRFSGLCNTRWGRTTNVGTQAYYIKASLRGFYYATGYKAANDVIWSNQQYTWPYPGFDWQACGKWSTSPIPSGTEGTCTP